MGGKRLHCGVIDSNRFERQFVFDEPLFIRLQQFQAGLRGITLLRLHSDSGKALQLAVFGVIAFYFTFEFGLAGGGGRECCSSCCKGFIN